MSDPALEGWAAADAVDFNGHVSAPWFAAAFGEANDRALERLGFGETWRRNSGHGLYVVEACYRYRRELKGGDAYRIETRPGLIDAKRLPLRHRMTAADDALVAEADILFLHVDKRGPRAAPFRYDERARLAALTPGRPAVTALHDFIHDLRHHDLLPEVDRMARLLLRNLLGVAAGALQTPLSRIVRDHAARHFGPGAVFARMLFAGRRVSPAGAALAGGMTIDALDAHDGHRRDAPAEAAA